MSELEDIAAVLAPTEDQLARIRGIVMAGSDSHGGDRISTAVRNDLSLLTVDQVCELLQVDRRWIYKACQRGVLPYVKVGKYLRFRHADLEVWLSRSRQETLKRQPASELPRPATAPVRGRPRKQR